jgi:hypothetical protein
LSTKAGAVVFFGRPRPLFAGLSSFTSTFFFGLPLATRFSEDDSWRSASSADCSDDSSLDLDVPARGFDVAGFLGLPAALLLEVDGLTVLATLFLDVEAFTGLTGFLVSDWRDSGFRLTGFLLEAFNGEVLPSLSS